MSNIRFILPPPPRNRDKSKNLQRVKTALRASTLTALGLLIALAVLLPNAAAKAQSSPASTTTATSTATATATPTDYDTDDDGLIDIKTLAQLNAVRYDLDGNGDATHADYIAAFPNRDTTTAGRMGCKLTDHDDDATTDPQATCTGYELMVDDLDFDTDGDGDVDDADARAHSYPNWTPIGTAASPFTATFKGNSNGATKKIATLSNLTITSISGGASNEAGLFGATSATAHIEGVGLVDVNVNIPTSLHNAKIGALVGNNAGKVTACYSTGAIDATVGFGSYAGGMVGYNTGTIAASFSRATVDMEMEAGATGGSMNIYAGGLAGHNTGTLTATYAAGAVKGKGGSGSYVGGLVGFNTAPADATSTTKTIIASYSIAPVTSVAYATTANAPTPTIGGLTGCCNDSATTNTITASYWDFITSGIDDDAGTAMPEGKSTQDLTSSTPTSANGIYVGWNTLTIDDVNNLNPWDFNSRRYQHPQLTYGGHAIDSSARTDQTNQYFATSKIISSYPENTVRPKVGMTLDTNRGPYRSLRARGHIGIVWESSPDGIDWTTLTARPYEEGAALRGAGPTYQFVPRDEHVGKYIRARLPFTFGYAYTRPIGKIKAASAGATADLGFTSGSAPPRVGTAITAALPSGVNRTDSRGLWQRCDDNTATPQGCELVGSLLSYTPGAADLDHYIRAYIYYKNSGGNWVRASTGLTTQKVADVQRVPWWR